MSKQKKHEEHVVPNENDTHGDSPLTPYGEELAAAEAIVLETVCTCEPSVKQNGFCPHGG